MHEQRADGLQLVVGKPASLMQNGTVRPITREPLTDTQIQGLLREHRARAAHKAAFGLVRSILRDTRDLMASL